MPILELPPNPAPLRDPPRDPVDGQADASAAAPPVKVRTGRFGELEEHELIHLLDAIDDELSQARFRESIYISTIVCLAVTWFLFYGPRVLFHQPQYRDPIAAMKENDRKITLEMPHTLPPRPPAHPMPDHKTLERLQRSQPRIAAPAPTAAPPPPQEQAHTAAPPVPQPSLPLPPAPARPTPQALPDAPRPIVAQNSTSARDAMQQAMQGARSGQSSGEYGAAPGGSTRPLQAGTEILSDTMGVDFSAYMRRLLNDIQRNWDPLIPEEVQPPLFKKGITGIRFTILPGGRIGSMILETPSGDRALDEAAWHGITSEGDFPPLPKEFHGPQLELRIGFYYNIPLPR
jgi:TonB family protein